MAEKVVKDASAHLRHGKLRADIYFGPDATALSLHETETGCGGACLLVDEARALRDWLNEVLP